MVRRCPNVVTSSRPYCADHLELGDYGPEWRKISDEQLAREPWCQCGCGRPAEVVDHVIPRSQGGTDDRSNLRSLARTCHGEKTWRIG
jgi:5-methylcytosine-specific restriction protein A